MKRQDVRNIRKLLSPHLANDYEDEVGF
jgi:hypothetical protein